MATLTPRQDIIGAAANVKNTFSSWDGCMAKSYCKWPAIIGIVVGTLIIVSILYCIGRCICCGKECVCCCFRCCGSSRGHKHLDSVPPTPYNNQYQSHAPPIYAGPGAFSQTATFDSSRKPVHEDSLPAMPSWETAASRKVEVLEEQTAAESHEMDRLKADGSPVPRSNATSPLARPIPMRDGSIPSVLSAQSTGIMHGSGVGADHPNNPYSTNPYAGPGRGYTASPTGFGSRTNLTGGDGYGGGYGNANQGYGGSGGGYGENHRPPQSPRFNPSSQTQDYQHSGYDRYGGGGATSGYGNTNPYGSSSYGNAPAANHGPYGGASSPRYGGNANPYDHGSRQQGGAWRDI